MAPVQQTQRFGTLPSQPAHDAQHNNFLTDSDNSDDDHELHPNRAHSPRQKRLSSSPTTTRPVLTLDTQKDEGVDDEYHL